MQRIEFIAETKEELLRKERLAKEEKIKKDMADFVRKHATEADFKRLVPRSTANPFAAPLTVAIPNTETQVVASPVPVVVPSDSTLAIRDPPVSAILKQADGLCSRLIQIVVLLMIAMMIFGSPYINNIAKNEFVAEKVSELKDIRTRGDFAKIWRSTIREQDMVIRSEWEGDRRGRTDCTSLISQTQKDVCFIRTKEADDLYYARLESLNMPISEVIRTDARDYTKDMLKVWNKVEEHFSITYKADLVEIQREANAMSAERDPINSLSGLVDVFLSFTTRLTTMHMTFLVSTYFFLYAVRNPAVFTTSSVNGLKWVLVSIATVVCYWYFRSFLSGGF